jgi:hypothetical protein
MKGSGDREILPLAGRQRNSDYRAICLLRLDLHLLIFRIDRDTLRGENCVSSDPHINLTVKRGLHANESLHVSFNR